MSERGIVILHDAWRELLPVRVRGLSRRERASATSCGSARRATPTLARSCRATPSRITSTAGERSRVTHGRPLMRPRVLGVLGGGGGGLGREPHVGERAVAVEVGEQARHLAAAHVEDVRAAPPAARLAEVEPARLSATAAPSARRGRARRRARGTRGPRRGSPPTRSGTRARCAPCGIPRPIFAPGSSAIAYSICASAQSTDRKLPRSQSARIACTSSRFSDISLSWTLTWQKGFLTRRFSARRINRMRCVRRDVQAPPAAGRSCAEPERIARHGGGRRRDRRAGPRAGGGDRGQNGLSPRRCSPSCARRG